MENLLLLSIPQWLLDIWNGYSEYLIPLLQGFLSILVPYISIKMNVNAKTENERSKLQIETLKNIVNRENYRVEIDNLTTSINELKAAIINEDCKINDLSTMFDTAFQNSSLDENVKKELTNVYSHLTNINVDSDTIIKDLQESNSMIKEKLETLAKTLETQTNLPEVVEEIVNETVNVEPTNKRRR